MSLYRVGKIWYVYFVHEGRRIRRSTGTDDRRQAQEYHDRLKAQFWRKEKLGEDPAHTWKEVAALWLSEAKRSPEDGYRLRWLSGRIGDVPLSSLTASRLEEILEAKATSPGSYNRYASLVSVILKRAQRRGWIQAVPKLARRKDRPGRLRWLTPKEWSRLKKALPPYLRQMARFALATGLRENNVLQLSWDQVDMARQVAWIHPDQAKTGTAIGVPLNEEAMKVLRQQKGKDPKWVFGLNGRPIYKASNRKWYRAVKEAGLEGFRWHDLRYAHLAPEHLAAYAGNVLPMKRPRKATPTPHKSSAQAKARAR